MAEVCEPIGVGMPGWLLLNAFARMLRETFPGTPYLVGSALQTKTPRDIDVRLILEDDDFHRLFGISSLNQPLTGWAHTCTVWSAYGTACVGRPIDFQIVCQSPAEARYGTQPRLALGNPPFGEAGNG